MRRTGEASEKQHSPTVEISGAVSPSLALHNPKALMRGTARRTGRRHVGMVRGQRSDAVLSMNRLMEQKTGREKTKDLEAAEGLRTRPSPESWRPQS